jgi:hypothetical protein
LGFEQRISGADLARLFIKEAMFHSVSNPIVTDTRWDQLAVCRLGVQMTLQMAWAFMGTHPQLSPAIPTKTMVARFFQGGPPS